MKKVFIMCIIWIILTFTFSYMSEFLGFTKDREYMTVFIALSIMTGIFTLIITAFYSYNDRD